MRSKCIGGALLLRAALCVSRASVRKISLASIFSLSKGELWGGEWMSFHGLASIDTNNKRMKSNIDAILRVVLFL